MAKKKIQIVSPDMDYINRILGKLAAVIDENYILEFITDEEYYKASLLNPKHIDTLIIDEKFAEKYSEDRIAGRVFIISDESGRGNAIRKYEGSAAVLKALGDEVLKRMDGVEKRKCRIVGVLSPYGGCGKTTAALGVALRLSQLHRRVLYIDAESTQNFYEKLSGGVINNTHADKKVAESLVNLTTESYDFIKNQIVHDSFDYLPAFEKSLMHYHITPSDLCKFAEVVSSKGGYDYIVVEHENMMNTELLSNLAAEQRLVIVTKDEKEDSRLSSILSVLDGIDADKVIVWHGENADVEKDIRGAVVSESIKYSEEQSVEKLKNTENYRKTAEAVL